MRRGVRIEAIREFLKGKVALTRVRVQVEETVKAEHPLPDTLHFWTPQPCIDTQLTQLLQTTTTPSIQSPLTSYSVYTISYQK